jgi:hypothetical protein
VLGSKLENFEAGTVRSITGPPAVRVSRPVACKARSVDWSEWFAPGVCPGGSPEAFPHHQPSMIGWIVAGALVGKRSAPAKAAAAMKPFTAVSFPPPDLAKLQLPSPRFKSH